LKLANSNHIVMVDDNEGDTKLARIGCEMANVPNRWLSFSNGPDFLDYLAKVRRGLAPMPALVLLDINLPGMTGLEVLEKTRSDPHFADLPIFCMLTSSSDPRDRAEAKSRGASGFVTKPDDIKDYVSFFRSLL
jgi:CheY-like chemotaxis protein